MDIWSWTTAQVSQYFKSSGELLLVLMVILLGVIFYICLSYSVASGKKGRISEPLCTHVFSPHVEFWWVMMALSGISLCSFIWPWCWRSSTRWHFCEPAVCFCSLSYCTKDSCSNSPSLGKGLKICLACECYGNHLALEILNTPKADYSDADPTIYTVPMMDLIK